MSISLLGLSIAILGVEVSSQQNGLWVSAGPDANLVQLSWPNATIGWAVGDLSYKTTDGGLTWAENRQSGALSHIFFLDTQIGWAVKQDYQSMIITIDGGTTWSDMAFPLATNQFIRQVWFTSSTAGFAVGRNRFLVTANLAGRRLTKKIGRAHV